ncbi:15495_t:CDS:1, partial [Gigaspora rosea]
LYIDIEITIGFHENRYCSTIALFKHFWIRLPKKRCQLLQIIGSRTGSLKHISLFGKQ